jgi:putative ABC transport system permease protein
MMSVMQPSPGVMRHDESGTASSSGDEEQRARAAAVWASLEVVTPEGVTLSTLEEIAHATGIGLDILWPDPLPASAASVDGIPLDAESREITSDATLDALTLLGTIPDTHAGGTMPLRETFRFVLHNLGANKTRGILTMLGIIIGVGAVVLLLAIGNGLLGYIDDITGRFGGNNVIIQPVRLVVNGIDTGMLTRTLSIADARALREPGAVPDAVAVSPTLQDQALIQVPGQNVATTVTGVWPDYLATSGTNLSSGSFITEDDVAAVAPVVTLGANVAHKLFGDADPIGQTVRINGTVLRVIGVMAAGESPLTGGGDDAVYVPLATMLDRLNDGQPSTIDGSTAVDGITLRASSSAKIDAVQNDSTALLEARHNLNGAAPDFKVSSLASAIAQRQQILGAVNAVMAVVAGISLVVGGIGIMNIMLVSVTERTREIGLRKALGARSRDIRTQFLIESMAISLVGAGIGVGVGMVLILIISIAWRPCPPSLPGIVIAVLAALATGLFFGVAPARRAAALQPIDALRAE